LGSFFSTGFDEGDISREFTKIITPTMSKKIKRIVQTGLFLNIDEISI
jgi:hypothetical protein